MELLSNDAVAHLKKRIHRWPLAVIVVSLAAFFLAYFKILGESRDYLEYELFLSNLRFFGAELFTSSRFEPGFTLLAFLLTRFIHSDAMVYSVIVSIAMFLKEGAICRISENPTIIVVTTVFYLARYFPLHELTQLRIAISAAFLIWAVILVQDGNRFYGLIACVVAIMFHMSSAVVIPVLIFLPAKRWSVMGIGLGIFGLVSFLKVFAVTCLASKIEIVASYEMCGFGAEWVNPLSGVLCLDWAMIAISFVLWDKLSSLMKRIVFMEIVGMAIFYGMIDFPIAAYRLRELYSVFWVLFVAEGLSLKVIRIPTAGFAIASISSFLYLYVFSGKLFS